MIYFKYPTARISESNIQAEFYKQCKDAGLSVYLEYKVSTSRFDAVVYNEVTNRILYIVEIKSYKDSKRIPNIYTKQLTKYSKFNTPILLIGRKEKVKDAIKYILNNKYPDESSKIITF